MFDPAVDKPFDFPELCDLSARLGADPLQIQGAGGNTSLKTDGVMWIKASGTWLMNAVEQNLFVPVALLPLLQAMKNGDPRAEKSVAFVIDALNPSALRPSIETTVHAVLPQRCVIHIHCVDTIALAIRQNAEQLLQEPLAGFKWAWIPYFRPGLPLSRAIVERIKADTDVLVLGNHGLVVAADTVEQAESLLEQVRAALRQPVRQPAMLANQSALIQRIAGTNYEVVNDANTHAIAYDQIALDIARGGSLYPDHVIFLGEGTVIAENDESCSDVCARMIAADQPAPVCIVFSGEGVLIDKDANTGQLALAACLSDVCARVPGNAPVNYLSARQTYELLNWEAEQYRQTLNL